MSGAPIYLHIPGDHVALEALADSVDRTLLSELRACESALSGNETNFEPSWGGAAADAFFRAGNELQREIQSSVSNFVARLGEVIRAYAWRLDRGKDLFAGYADSASRYGLIVQGEYILAPTRRDPNDADAPCSVTDIVGPEPVIPGAGSVFALFEEIADHVGTWHGEHIAWVAEHFGALFAGAPAAAGLSKLLDHFAVTEPALFAEAMSSANHGVVANIEGLKEHHAAEMLHRQQFLRDQRNNNLAVRQSQDAASGRRLTRGILEVEQSLANWSRTGSVLRGLGAAGTVADTWQGLSSGESWGTSASGLLGSYVGAQTGFRIGAQIKPLGLLGGIGGGIVGAIVGSGVGKGLWDQDNGEYQPAVPLGLCESVESWLTNPGELSVNSPRLA